MFFFSSRRRHTRSLCDWSSDVCSSDLYSAGAVFGKVDWQPGLQVASPPCRKPLRRNICSRGVVIPVHVQLGRSEERRVGKECRSWWSGCHITKKKKRTLTQVSEYTQYC